MKTETLPKITHAQYLVLALLEAGVTDGQEIHQRLAEMEASTDKPAFYQLMRRMEGAGLVKGSYVMRRTDSTQGRSPRSRRFRVYAITPKGRLERESALQFYSEAAAA